jgi:hypothetical protein
MTSGSCCRPALLPVSSASTTAASSTKPTCATAPGPSWRLRPRKRRHVPGMWTQATCGGDLAANCGPDLGVG